MSHFALQLMRQCRNVQPDLRHSPAEAHPGHLVLLSAHRKPTAKEGAWVPVGGGGVGWVPVGGSGGACVVVGAGGWVGGGVEPPQTLQLCGQFGSIYPGAD